LLEREDQAADRRHVVIGGRGEAALRRRAGRTPCPDELLRGLLGRGLARRLGKLERRPRRVFRRLLLGRLLAFQLWGLVAFGVDALGESALALALLRLEPFC
jgi:hypothetical protein